MEILVIVPIEQVGNYRGPEYFEWRFDQNPPSIVADWVMIDYGFINEALLYAPDVLQVDYNSLILHPNVYAFNLAGLDNAISDKPALTAFFEPIHIPTDWTTPSTTYRQFLRDLAGIFSFNQRYLVISGGQSFLGNGITLETRWNELTAEQKAWFNATVVSFGFQFTVSGNPKLRTLAKQAGSFWETQPFTLGIFTF